METFKVDTNINLIKSQQANNFFRLQLFCKLELAKLSAMNHAAPKLKRFQSFYEQQQLVTPMIDDSIIANIDQIISSFKNPDKSKTRENLSRSLEELKKIKKFLQDLKLDNISLSSSSNVSISSSDSETIRNSIKMVENGGMFVKPITSQTSAENSWSAHTIVSPKGSMTSFENVNFSPSSNARKNYAEVMANPKVVKTFDADCLIHMFDDKSFTFEIMRHNAFTNIGDGRESPVEIVIVALPDGTTGLFTSKDSTLFSSEVK